jgi:cytochrome c556
MFGKPVTALCALALAGCGPQQSNEAANSNAVVQSAETRTGGTEPETQPAVPVDAETAKKLMKERHDNYEEIGDSMKVITRQLKSSNPDLDKIRKGADTIATLAPQVPGWFPAGSGPEAGKTHAKAEIWQRPDDFAAKAKAFEQAATAFRTTAQGTDLEAIRSAHADLGKSCKACHDLYREED